MSRRPRSGPTLAGITVALVATLGLAACGGDDGDAGPAPTVAPTVAPTGAPEAPAPPTGAPAPDGPASGADPAVGESIAQSKGCMSCHQIDADGVGPKWGGLYGSEVELEDGSTVLVDEAYLHRAITDPGAERVAGYYVAMPTVELSEDEVAAIIAYIASLGG